MNCCTFPAAGPPSVAGSLSEPPAVVRIVVLGCRPRLRSGKHNRYLVGRVASAAAAYHHTAGRQILCSGRADEAVAMAAKLAEWNGEVTGDAHESFYRTSPLVAKLRIEGARVIEVPTESGQT